jgi:hypothetical protein
MPMLLRLQICRLVHLMVGGRPKLPTSVWVAAQALLLLKKPIMGAKELQTALQDT